MANRPYQEKVDQFMADYQDKFLPTLITGKGGGEGIAKSQETTFAGMPMSKEQAQLERDKILAASIHPDTFGKVLDVMKGEGTIPSHRIAPGTPMSGFSNSPEGQAIMRDRATPIPHVSTGFPPPTGGIPNELLRGGAGVVGGAEVPSDLSVAELLRGKGLPAPGVSGAGKPISGDGWDWRKELAETGTWSEGPERFFLGGKEVLSGTPGAVSGDRLARERISSEGGSAIPVTAGGNISTYQSGEYPVMIGGRQVMVPRFTTGIEGRPDSGTGKQWEDYTKSRPIPSGEEQFEMPGEIKTALQAIQKILMTPTARPWSPQGYLGKEGGYSKAKLGALEDFGGTLEKLAGHGMGYRAKMAEIGAEKPYREAMADYYRRMAGVHEAGVPGELFQRYGAGMHSLAEAERPYAFSPNSAVYKGAKLLGYVPDKPEAIHPIIRDVINKSMMVDPNTGMQTGFDIRGARQKIGYIAPWLKSQGIDVPKESYKMTKGEFLAEQKAFTGRLPKKDRAKYTPQYIEGLWTEYWGKD